MAVLDVQKKARELGRIRMGDKGQRGQPQRLAEFRLTSPDRKLLEAAAARYGGEVRPWQGNPGQFELYTQVSELPCMLPAQEVSQWYELWNAGGCARRCDGQTVTLSVNGNVDTQECVCDPDQRECKLVTRLSVILQELPGVGVWRLETHGYYAATELPAAAEILVGLARRGAFPPAFLAIEERVVKRDGATKKFPVPVIRIAQPLVTLMTGEVVSTPALPAPSRALPEPAHARTEQAVRSAEKPLPIAGGSQPSQTPPELELASPAVNGHGLRCSVGDCGKPLTQGQRDVSTRAFGRALCPNCQKSEAGARAR